MNNIKNRAEEIVYNEIIYVYEDFKMSFREINEDNILKDLYEIRNESLGCNLSDSDKEHELLID